MRLSTNNPIISLVSNHSQSRNSVSYLNGITTTNGIATRTELRTNRAANPCPALGGMIGIFW